ncbi:latent-transforming growth factor beta-binding protein 1 isoform X3 [Astyanax mexicanus]|uniref:latent-transforming growth factor beta-binding protein 1 isoform X3 n=1 Tax=Astyanax mexicanus TaxID=7994 RepID=UPI0020CB30F8|nr:latent-transforming growth factor beta-binding protein 1 isoform X3 [Astyanax mexicanus]
MAPLGWVGVSWLWLAVLGWSALAADRGGVRTLYVLQPGRGSSDAVRVSSISSHTGADGQPHSYNVELTASYGGQVRTRRMGSREPHTGQQMVKTSGVNVCGGQCCIGWSKAPGSQRCTKPNCSPKCQNGGMCLRPQMCVCKPGSKGKSCEQTTLPPFSHPSNPGNGHTNGHTTGHTNGHAGGHPNVHNVVPQRPIPQQVLPHGSVQGPLPLPGSNMPHMTLTMKASPNGGPIPFQQHVQPPVSMTMHQSKSQKFVIKPKYYHTHTQVHGVGQTPERSIPLTVGHHPLTGNHTGRIKVVFTPTICKVTCMSGRCQNTCEKGNTTTIISENGRATDTLTAPNFRVVVCHLPCMNGGKCSTRDKCQCPPNFTGKFCQMPAQNGHRGQQMVVNGQGAQVHSTHTLPMTYSSGQNQGVVNIHVKHPPEASVQIHQVSQVDSSSNGHSKMSQSGHSYSYHMSESSSSSSSSSSSQKIQHHSHSVIYPNQQAFLQYQPVTSKSQLGRCFQETTGTQCGKALPGLSKQEDCCGTIGTSWGFHKCQKCPRKTPIPQLECPQGYKRFNGTRCIDINECQLQGVCPNGNCINTMGSYRCLCKAGFIPDATLTTCYPEALPVREERGACFRLVGPGAQCLHPVSTQLSKQLCCCSVGKAWGPHCDRCPLPGTAAFKEICPGGMGYHVTTPYVYKPKPPPSNPRNHPDNHGQTKPTIRHQEPVPGVLPLPFPTLQQPVEAFSFTERQLPIVPVATASPEQELSSSAGIDRSIVEQHQLSPGVSTIPMEPAYPEVVEKTSPAAPVAILPSSASQDISPTQLAEVDECIVSPQICGPGFCYNTAESYRCICNEGYRLDDEGNTCIDIDECADSPDLCSNGRCKNTPGSFLCACHLGFIPDEEGTSCIDMNECEVPRMCPENSLCVNTLGSYNCRLCDSGYRLGLSGQCEDVDECQDGRVCPSGLCYNTLGSFMCSPCPEGFQGRDGQCVDIDECLDRLACAHGQCSNHEGYFSCTCDEGFVPASDGKACIDIDECQDESMCTRGHCQNTEGSFICSCETGFRLASSGEQCDDVDECQELTGLCDGVGQCVNNMGSYYCNCPPGYRQVNGTSCQDVDECVEEAHLQLHDGKCVNTEGSFLFICEPGYMLTQDPPGCEDVDECMDGSKCLNGTCLNTDGSFQCQCDGGYRLELASHTCRDIDECAEYGQSICGAWQCENTPGSYRCVVPCPAGHTRNTHGACVDVDECALNRSVCRGHGVCQNTVGSFMCQCDPGYQDSDGQGCVDLNECDLLSDVCGEAVCENVPGSFLCVCPDEGLEFNRMTAKCLPTPKASSVERKECYYNLNDENLCDNVLTSSVTIEECCCTLGAGWGDNCEVFPCPVQGTDQFAQMCPAGQGSVPTGNAVFGVSSADGYKDADECFLFGMEICKDGFCLNTDGGYECYCKAGFYYHETKLQCIDTDECADESNCVDGQCLNNHGSYQCFCSPPMVLAPDNKRCVFPDVAEKTGHTEQSVYQSVCWEFLTETKVCSHPLSNQMTTYTECCCLYGEAWGMDCALCPQRNTEEYNSMCNLRGSVSSRRPYGRDALVASPVHEYEVREYEQRRVDPNPAFYEEYDSPNTGQYDSFEGLRAEECGVLNGCENGRCVRVQEGYTCDCFDGYTLDMSRMACVDVNECSELNKRMSLCKNGKCINTPGSYRCQCLPGFTQSDRPNYCVPSQESSPSSARTATE